VPLPFPQRAHQLVLALAFALLAAAPARAADLVPALKDGGYVVVMRHAHSPAAPPAQDQVDPANHTGERQLDAQGKAEAAAIGRGLKAGAVPIGTVYSSPTFRALQTVLLMGFRRATAQAELGDGGSSMAASAAGQAGTAWLKAKAAEVPAKGTDVLIVTHGPNIALAFGDALKDLGDGEAAVFRPDGAGGFSLAGRIKPDAWGG
jgi:phosphohistidine phosphatase SixA